MSTAQPTPQGENLMATKTSKATKNNKSKSTKKDSPMTANENILNIFNTFIEAGGMPKVTEFKKGLLQLMFV